MKFPFSLSLKLVFRLLLPGFIVMVALFPVVQAIFKYANLDISSETIFSVGIVLIGYLFIIFDMHIYMLFEGRRYLPFYDCFLKLERRRLYHFKKLEKKYRNSGEPIYGEISVELRRFPINEKGAFYAKYPTRLGNLLASYEDYPERRYGMDGVFYWYRIWLTLHNDIREELDSRQAMVDSTVYSGVALIINAIILAIYAVLQANGFSMVSGLPNALILLVFSISCIMLHYGLYRGSLYLHANYGEAFKSLFDMHKDNVNAMVENAINEIILITNDPTLKTKPQSEKYLIAWRYLHNYRIRTKDGLFTVPELKEKKPTQELLRTSRIKRKETNSRVVAHTR
jgi:hypothetical protein